MPPVGFEPTISAGERPQTHDLDRTATGGGIFILSLRKYYKLTHITQYKTPLTFINCPVQPCMLYSTKLLSSYKAGKMKQLCVA
jgi:hypothetical protein